MIDAQRTVREYEMKKTILTLILIPLQNAALAEEPTLERCHNISGDSTRLLCYDKASGYVPEVSLRKNPNVKEVVRAGDGGQWQFAEENSALDGRRDVWLSVQSANTEGNAIGSPIRAQFYVRCMQNKTNAFIAFDRYTTDSQNVKYRFDDGGIQSQWMEVMRGGDGIGIWSGRRAIPFVRKVFNKEKLVLSYNTYTGPVEFSFDVSGLRERIDPLAEGCSWSP